MDYETPLKSFSAGGPDLSSDFLREFFVDMVRSFEENVIRKLRSINHPRRSFFQPERTIHLDGVHRFLFVESFAKKLGTFEICHTPPTDKLRYNISCFMRWCEILGNADALLRKNDAGDWSLLTPLACLIRDCEACGLAKGACVVPLEQRENDYIVFRPSPDLPLTPLTDKNFRHSRTLAGKATVRKFDKFFVLEVASGSSDCPVAEGDEVNLGSFVATVVKVTESRAGVFFVDVDAVSSVASGSRPLNCYMRKTVKLYGSHFTIPKASLRVYKPVELKCDTKKETFEITAHTLNVNGFGFLTMEGFTHIED